MSTTMHKLTILEFLKSKPRGTAMSHGAICKELGVESGSLEYRAVGTILYDQLYLKDKAIIAFTKEGEYAGDSKRASKVYLVAGRYTQ